MTTLFGIEKAEVQRLVGAVSDGDAADGFARSAFTCLAEPGDRIAVQLIAELGAADALRVVIDRATPVVEGISPKELSEALDRWLPRLGTNTATLALSQAARFGVRLLTPGSAHWPSGADDLDHHAPIALWLRGNVSAVRSLDHSIALVGARAATGYGEHVTMEASAGLVDRGFAIVSGAAYGIDGMAHRAALASRGTTVAFLAGGVDRFYPSGHDALLTRIVEQGAVLSEVPCGVAPTKWRFLQRNRLIAAVSQATVVLEAGWRSGSLNTAGHALDLGRPLGAVPGPVTSAASAGCHRIIREHGATLVTTPDEMAELAGRAPVIEPAEISAEHAESARLLDSLSTRSPRDAPDLARRAGLAVGTVQALLGTLELEGRVAERERGWVRTA